ncbi:hypothetical protein F5Y04DRAFT_283125 [Hypomontagnella monticulosa]|nr:hypothetical protein F5Y04DRAFT_283125 [Hypomontagnella monticulosa]
MRTNSASILRLSPTELAFSNRLFASSPQTDARRRESHRPQSDVPEEDEIYYILTILTDAPHHQTMCALRERYYPPALLRIPAHISLFRALPGSKLPLLRIEVAAAVSRLKPFKICAVGPPIRIGRNGAGVSVTGLEPARELVRTFQEKWRDVLSRQDRRAFHGHYTIMNKVDDPGVLTRCMGELCRYFDPGGCPGMALGLTLWQYNGGWWKREADFAFSGVG